MSGKAKQVAGFLLCSSAFTQRNVVSLALVGLFFLVYVYLEEKLRLLFPSVLILWGLSRLRKSRRKLSRKKN